MLVLSLLIELITISYFIPLPKTFSMLTKCFLVLVLFFVGLHLTFRVVFAAGYQ